MKLDEMTKLDYAVEDADRQLENLKSQLDLRAGCLKDTLSRLQRRLETEGVTANINELGEVQGQGHEVDRLCALFKAQQDHCKVLRRLQGSQS